MRYSVDQFGVYRQHEDTLEVIKIIEPISGNTDYQEMLAWVAGAGAFDSFFADNPLTDLHSYKLEAFNSLLASGNRFVASLTGDMLDCEIQAFPVLIKQAMDYQAGVRGTAVLQITIQAMMTNKTPEQVVALTLQLDQQQSSVVAIMSSMRQNVRDMLNACTTHEQVDVVKEQAKATGSAAVAQILAELGNE